MEMKSEQRISRRTLFKNLSLLTASLALSSCEQQTKIESLQNDINSVVNKLQKNQPQTKIVTSEEGDVFHISIYSESIVFNNGRVIKAFYTVPKPVSNIRAQSHPTLKIDTIRLSKNNTQEVMMFTDVGANGLRADELDELRIETYRGNTILKDELYQASAQEKIGIDWLNDIYHAAIREIKENW